MSSSNAEITTAYTTATTGGYCNAAALALLLYETFVTFDREVRHVWRRKISAVTWMFLLNRYFIIALYAVDMPSTFRIGNSSCPVLARLSQVLIIIAYTTWAAFSSLRTYAIWDRAWHVALLVLMLSLVPVWIYIYRDAHEYVVAYIPSCEGGDHLTCSLYFESDTVTIVTRTCLICSDLLVLSVTWTKTYGIMRLSREHGKSTPLSLTAVLLRDGSIYFTIWTVLNALHIAGTYVQSIQYITIFTEAATSILISRFILNLREVAAGRSFSEVDPTTDQYWDLISWHAASASPHSAQTRASQFLASLGAPLDHGIRISCMESDGDDPIHGGLCYELG